MAAVVAAKAEFLSQHVLASRSEVVGQKPGAKRVVSLLNFGKKDVEKAVKKGAGKAAKAVKKAATKVNAPSNEELAKWYGPDRRIYLPEGLLAKDEIPEYLTGEVPGDYGYHPLGLTKKPEDFDKILTDFTQEEPSTLWVLPKIPTSSPC